VNTFAVALSDVVALQSELVDITSGNIVFQDLEHRDAGQNEQG
jgi:hypothetical protein